MLCGAFVAISLVLGPVATAASSPALKANHPASSVSPGGSILPSTPVDQIGKPLA